MTTSIQQKVITDLTPYIEAEKAALLPRFFQTQPGGYGEGDRFLGVRVPNIRKVAKTYRSITLRSLASLLHSPWHELRLAALFILIDQYKRAKDKQHYIDFYLAHIEYVNNWDLVDSSCYHLLGDHLLGHLDRTLLYEYTTSNSLWLRRIAIVTTMAFIRQEQLDDTFNIAHILLHDHHDLIHKAVGWMLREAGKKDKKRLMHFLKAYAAVMPRTMLRYAIEKFEKQERRYYMQLKQRSRAY